MSEFEDFIKKLAEESSNPKAVKKLAELSNDPRTLVNCFYTGDPSLDFNNHYKNNRDRILKCKGVALGSEGVQLDGREIEIGFEEDKGQYWSQFKPIFTTRVPYFVFEEMGYHVGDEVDKLAVFAEVLNPKNINVYLGHFRRKPISKKRIREIHEGMDRFLGDPEADLDID